MNKKNASNKIAMVPKLKKKDEGKNQTLNKRFQNHLKKNLSN